MSDKISLVVITKNEERNIERCLRSVDGIVDEIIIFDSYSTDQTEEICSRFKAKFFKVDWQGYANTKNSANAQATFDWILSLDADEELDTELRNEILSAKKTLNDFQGYQIRRKPFFCGKEIKYSGWNHDEKIRLFNRKYAKWIGNYVHEKLYLDPKTKIKKLKGYCHHYTVATLAESVNANNRYSELQMQEIIEKDGRVTLYHLVLKPFFEFFRCYFIKRGFLDGWAGFILSVENSHAKFLKFAKVKIERMKIQQIKIAPKAKNDPTNR